MNAVTFPGMTGRHPGASRACLRALPSSLETRRPGRAG